MIGENGILVQFLVDDVPAKRIRMNEDQLRLLECLRDLDYIIDGHVDFFEVDPEDEKELDIRKEG